MVVPRPPHLLRRVVRVAEGRPWHGRRRMCMQVHVRIAEQRQNRVVERRGRKLDLTPLGGETIFRNDATENLELDFAEIALVLFREMALPLEQPADARIAVEVERIDPGELVPHLEIEEVLVRVAGARIAFPQQLGVTRIHVDHPPPGRMEKFGQRRGAFIGGELCRGLEAELEVPVARAVFGKGFELDQQRRHQIEGHLDLRELPQQGDHPEVVLQRVHAHPRQHVLPRCQIFVVGLVHVPEDGDLSHGCRRRRCGIFEANPKCYGSLTVTCCASSWPRSGSRWCC